MTVRLAGTSLCLAATGPSIAPLTLANCDNSKAQIWYMHPNGRMYNHAYPGWCATAWADADQVDGLYAFRLAPCNEYAWNQVGLWVASTPPAA